MNLNLSKLRESLTEGVHHAGIPCELLQHWDPAQPLLVGGLGASEEGRGFLQLRLKRHRWFGRLLKNRDPLTFSVGWRRFQSIPVYATEDANGRHRCAWLAQSSSIREVAINPDGIVV